MPVLSESELALAESVPAGYVPLLVESDSAEETSTEDLVYLNLPPSQVAEGRVGGVLVTVHEGRKEYRWVDYPF